MKRWALGFGLVVIATIIAADLDLLGCLRPIHEIPLADKLVHFALYGLLNFFTILAIGESRPSWGGVSILTGSSLVIAAAAALEEFSQRYIAARTFSAWDLVAGIAGVIAFGVLAVRYLNRARESRPS